MADFSGSGIPDLPTTTVDSLRHGNPAVLGWLTEAIQDGDRILRGDPSYEGIERAQQYVAGEQLAEEQKAKYLPQVTINECRKAVQAHVSSLTDVKPVFGWRASNPAYTLHADLLNQLAVVEWVTQMFDLDLGDCIKYALVCGTGDLVVDWDPHAPMGGANTLSARDPRDTLPIRPSYGRSLQSWSGVILREEHTVNALRAMYPTRGYLFSAASDTALSRVAGRFRTALSRLITPADPLDRLGQTGIHTRRTRSGAVVLYRTYLRDHTRNLTTGPIVMGEPGSAWAYVVPPNAPLYPRGRLIVSTDTAIVYDGPNTYNHGLFPVCRLKLWSLPWHFLGLPLFHDLLPVQDAINDTVNDLRLGARQWMDPDLLYNRNAVSEATMRLTDPRRPGKKIKVNPGFGEPFSKLNGPAPQVLGVLSELWDKLTTKFTDLSGTANLTALLQLRQMPAADTIEKYYEALTPEIRHEARQVEAFMRELSEMIKGNYFQFQTTAKRVALLGDAAVTLADVDADPGTLVPALRPGEAGYTPELDADTTSPDERARFFQKQFVFVVAPNSILAMDGTERKMITMQNFRMGVVDFWTYHEVLETPNVGAPPAIPLPPLQPIDPATQQLIIQQTLLQSMQSLGSGLQGGPSPVVDPQTNKTYQLDPMSGQILEIRVPTTITERLQAQQLLGIGLVANSAGRKASGEAPPKMESKNDEPGGRPTVTESRK